MRILIITNDYAAGPLASLTHHVTHALVRLAQREGHHVRVGSMMGKSGVHGHSTWVGGAAVTTIDKDAAYAASAAFAKWLQDQQVDVIHCIAPVPEAVDLPWPQMQSPSVVTLTSLPESEGTVPGFAPAWLRQARHRVCATPAAQVHWHTNLAGQAFRVLPHGVDLLALLRKFPQWGALAPRPHSPTVASVQPLDLPAPVRWVPLHAVSLLGLESTVDAVVMPPVDATGFSLIANECAALGLPCLKPSQLSPWLAQWPSASGSPALQAMDQPMRTRIEEEAFFYDCLYRQ